MAPRIANVFDSLGFAGVQDLSLLQLHHTRADLVDVPADITPRTMPTGRLARRFRSSSFKNILALDAESFGTDWQMDMANFTDALSATSQSRVLVSHHNNELVGFVLAGCTGQHGFIQRLAVRPQSRRSGVATCLLAASLNWIINNGCTDTVVNTEVANYSAQNLYRKFGFVDMNHGLIVMEREL
jgi:ribosomal-protein-alanine N-acetyltransferase